MANTLENRVAVITGSGAGIGMVTALAMAREGAKVVVNDIIAESAENVAAELVANGAEAIPFVGDISNFEIAGKLIRAAVDKFGKIDILHNNAAIIESNPIWKFTEKDWDLVLGVNLKGIFNCIRHASPYMMEQKWGRIINASSGAHRGTPWDAAYCASKAGILGLTGTVAIDLKPYGITCNAYLPTAATQLNTGEKMIRFFDQVYREGLLSKELYELLSNPPPAEKIPPMLIYLCTEEAANITGQVFDIMGDFISIYAESHKRRTIFNPAGWTVADLKSVVPEVLLSQD